ncbi:centrosomin-like isoform X1 [Maniola hyperantus]|uniref:centrosomin-like isoform X1 n=1 Tax=Aphantopus hyperantus TaxID=2795564 RepID=UPI00156976B2|nr:centrosomin-like isoform X1 [Maniola hyperantus]XP_034825565.1 centrosomin-like isoform X1 [Maniola hyperantus]
MATLPRMNTSKHGASTISSPFSTSPRKLQEMTLPSDGHDVTTASGVSMKQFEEQINSLRKENFHLKLRIYFLEEKLGSGAPPVVQGLLEHNVRLQVEVEELKRQLNDKQELLAAAAEAIDVLENQGSTSTEAADLSINNSIVRKETNEPSKVADPQTDAVDETCQSESAAGDYLAVTVNNESLDQLTRLKKENRKALQMIKGCMKKIQQQDQDIKKLKLNKELTYAQVSDSHIENYQEILKCKDEHIKDLENKLRLLQNTVENIQNDDETGNLQQLLTRRLQGLAYFLDKLLSHKCVLGEEKKKLAESILEQSLALPVGLQLDETMAPAEFSMDESNLDISQSMRIEDLTLMFGHHLACGSDNNHNSFKKQLRHIPQADIISESECWSEPDRNVSLARVGLCDTGVAARECVSEANRYRTRRSRLSYGSRSEDNKPIQENALLEQNDISALNRQLEEEKRELTNKLDQAIQQINDLVSENDDLKAALDTERTNATDTNNRLEIVQAALIALERKLADNEQQIVCNVQLVEKLRAEKQELESTFMETERSLRRAADEATVQASKVALERAQVQHDKFLIERELEQTREKLSAAMETNAQLEIEVTRRVAMEDDDKNVEPREGLPAEEDRSTSPDQGIDSDRLSSLEHNDAVNLSPRSLYEENKTLKQKLSRTKATLAETLIQLNASNMRKMGVQRAICREIHKTHGVLRQVRGHVEHQK